MLKALYVVVIIGETVINESIAIIVAGVNTFAHLTILPSTVLSVALCPKQIAVSPVIGSVGCIATLSIK